MGMSAGHLDPSKTAIPTPEISKDGRARSLCGQAMLRDDLGVARHLLRSQRRVL